MIWVAIGLILVGVQALIIGVIYGGRRAEREADRPTPGAGVRLPDLSDVLRARLAVANRLAEANAGQLDAVDAHFRTAAALLQPDRDPDQDCIDAEAHRLLAALDIPTIPGDPS